MLSVANNTFIAECLYAECHYAECRGAETRTVAKNHLVSFQFFNQIKT